MSETQSSIQFLPGRGVDGLTPFDVAILTVQRSPDYCTQTVASLFASGREVWNVVPVHLVVGSPDDEYLSNLSRYTSLRIHRLSDESWNEISDWSVHRRLSHNLWRALELPCHAQLGRCVCEDDVLFQQGFVSKLLDAIDELRSSAIDKFILTAYSHYDFAAEPERYRGRFHCSYNAAVHYGNCCFFVSKALLDELAQAIRQRAVDELEAPADIVLGRFGEELWQRKEGGMYQTISSIVQHMGVVSGGTSGQYSCSPTFDRPWPVECGARQP